ncbi:hypothetical protein CVT24_008782 [Panaeolus cyanescens]|uniref:Amine oxidase domain-containing protein n=1 Tax=Panaeolus cyanescens TaxID=181874 RepID=A0A409WEG6_9AGAR|nr:hypothetical protein CVT24_008782 [Panaeolus cyanescens]
MAASEDGSSVRRKVVQYYLDQLHEDLATRNSQVQVTDLPFLERLSTLYEKEDPTALRHEAIATPIAVPTIDPSPNVTWENLCKSHVFSELEPGRAPDHDRRDPIPHIPIRRRGDHHKDGKVDCPPWYRVAIIGAGVAGLRAAMLLQSKGIPYDILEASGRAGGRAFTYKFSPGSTPGKHDYYDVGAMRFPKNDANAITFKLFKELGMTDSSGHLIDYVLSDSNNILMFNGQKTNSQIANTTPGNHFGDDVMGTYVNLETKNLRGEPVYGVNACTSVAFDRFRKALVTKGNFKKGWEELLRYDWASTRTYLSQYPASISQWMETRNSSTGGYDSALSEVRSVVHLPCQRRVHNVDLSMSVLIPC